MSREATAQSPRRSKRADVEIMTSGDATHARVLGMLDEHFPGFGELTTSVVTIDLSGITFITSFGVRQWLRTMAALPASAAHVYFIGCPRIFVEQLNMILNFGGRGQILTLLAPYRCTACGAESDETIDAVAEAGNILQGKVPQPECKKCKGTIVLDEMPDVYFACLAKYGPTNVHPAATQLLASDVGKLQKQVIKAHAPAKKSSAKVAATATGERKGSVVWIVVVAVLLAALAGGLYVLVGPS